MELNTLDLPIAQWLHRVLITDLKQLKTPQASLSHTHMEAGSEMHWGEAQADLQRQETSSSGCLCQPSCLPEVSYESPAL